MVRRDLHVKLWCPISCVVMCMSCQKQTVHSTISCAANCFVLNTLQTAKKHFHKFKLLYTMSTCMS